jgi:hypothetical protein
MKTLSVPSLKGEIVLSMVSAVRPGGGAWEGIQRLQGQTHRRAYRVQHVSIRKAANG